MRTFIEAMRGGVASRRDVAESLPNGLDVVDVAAAGARGGILVFFHERHTRRAIRFSRRRLSRLKGRGTTGSAWCGQYRPRRIDVAITPTNSQL